MSTTLPTRGCRSSGTEYFFSKSMDTFAGSVDTCKNNSMQLAAVHSRLQDSSILQCLQQWNTGYDHWVYAVNQQGDKLEGYIPHGLNATVLAADLTSMKYYICEGEPDGTDYDSTSKYNDIGWAGLIFLIAVLTVVVGFGIWYWKYLVSYICQRLRSRRNAEHRAEELRIGSNGDIRMEMMAIRDGRSDQHSNNEASPLPTSNTDSHSKADDSWGVVGMREAEGSPQLMEQILNQLEVQMSESMEFLAGSESTAETKKHDESKKLPELIKQILEQLNQEWPDLNFDTSLLTRLLQVYHELDDQYFKEQCKIDIPDDTDTPVDTDTSSTSGVSSAVRRPSYFLAVTDGVIEMPDFEPMKGFSDEADDFVLAHHGISLGLTRDILEYIWMEWDDKDLEDAYRMLLLV